MSVKNIDELTVDEIKEQMALFQRLYYRKKMETDPDYVERKRELGRKKYERKKERLYNEGKIKEGKVKPHNQKYNSENLMLLAPMPQ